MKKNSLFLVVILFFSIYAAFAQVDEEDPLVPAAPISDYVPLLLVLGLIYAVSFFKSKKSPK